MTGTAPLIGVNLLFARPGYTGGTVRYAREIIRALARDARYRLILYTRKGVFAADDPDLAGIPRREFRCPLGLLSRVLVEQVILPLWLRRDDVDVVFSPAFVSPLWGRARKVVTIHDMYYWRYPDFVRPWQRRYWTVMVPWSLRRVDGVIAVSGATRDDVLAAYPWARQKIHVIHHGSDALPSGRPGTRQGNAYCIMVGNVTPNKNVETVISAMDLLTRRGVPIVLRVVGSDHAGCLRRALAARSDIEVDHISTASDEDLACWLSHAVCHVQASRYEGFGLPVLEAMAAGCPVIANDLPVFREICGDAAYLVAMTPESLAHAIETLLGNPELRAQLMARGKERARLFDWARSARETAAVFDLVMDGTPDPGCGSRQRDSARNDLAAGAPPPRRSVEDARGPEPD